MLNSLMINKKAMSYMSHLIILGYSKAQGYSAILLPCFPPPDKVDWLVLTYSEGLPRPVNYFCAKPLHQDSNKKLYFPLAGN